MFLSGGPLLNLYSALFKMVFHVFGSKSLSVGSLYSALFKTMLQRLASRQLKARRCCVTFGSCTCVRFRVFLAVLSTIFTDLVICSFPSRQYHLCMFNGWTPDQLEPILEPISFLSFTKKGKQKLSWQWSYSSENSLMNLCHLKPSWSVIMSKVAALALDFAVIGWDIVSRLLRQLLGTGLSTTQICLLAHMMCWFFNISWNCAALYTIRLSRASESLQNTNCKNVFYLVIQR